MGKSKSRWEDGETPTQLGNIGKGVTETKAAVVGWMVLLGWQNRTSFEQLLCGLRTLKEPSKEEHWMDCDNVEDKG